MNCKTCLPQSPAASHLSLLLTGAFHEGVNTGSAVAPPSPPHPSSSPSSSFILIQYVKVCPSLFPSQYALSCCPPPHRISDGAGKEADERTNHSRVSCQIRQLIKKSCTSMPVIAHC
ncbi:hypothetical protein LY78DRAFT_278931 [Colletotrichum sublineola]|nr:hypothetical protein LY78DRAFT_278931 [Colletotrichum sublineola]